MNFFEHQEQARSSTGKLLLLFTLAIAALVGVTSYVVALALATTEARSGRPVNLQGPIPLDIVLGTAMVIVSVVGLGALYRIAQLRSGGRVIAESMGGRLLNRHDAGADENKILNVVEEMALAAGMPVPPVYIIDDDAINAFAAGYRQQDAVIGITRGAIRLLKRDELQGVIAHEFSHIFNGDMRLNLRLIGWLHGLLLLGLIGGQLLRFRYLAGSRKNNAAGAMVVLGLALAVLGYTGVFFGNLIKSAVSRQREFLADASAVQFTRNPEGIGNALKKIGGYALGSRLMTQEATEISHMLFGEGEMRRGIGGMFATHPPLAERIRRIDPRWDGQLINPEKEREIAYSSLPDEPPAASVQATASNAEKLATVLVGAVGTASAQSLGFAQAHLSAIPDSAKQQLHTPLEASLLMFGVLIAQSHPQVARTQLEFLQKQLPAASFSLLAQQLKMLMPMARELDLTLVELAQPALRQLSPDQLRQFLKMINELITIDGEVTLDEWCMGRLLTHYLDDSQGMPARLSLDDCLEECRVLLSSLAVAGHDDEDAKAAFAAGCNSAQIPVVTLLASDIHALENAIDKLVQLKPLQKPRLLKAMVACVQHDGKVTAEELDLLRVVAAVLDCPLPPLH